VLDLIASGEGGWTSINRGRAGDTPGGYPGLDQLTLAQVQGLQANGYLAVGRYQFIPETLRIAMRDSGLTGADLFSPENQDRLAVALLLGGKRPKLADYLQGGRTSLEEAQTDLAYEWASLPLPSGKGAYDGDDAGNRASQEVAAIQEALQRGRAALGGMARYQPLLPKLQQPAQQPPKASSGRAIPTTGGGWQLDGFPFFSQVDPSDGAEGWRQCQTSSLAMALRFLNVKGIIDDTDYLRIVRQFGDTTAQETHRKALAKLGVKARFVQNCTVAQAQAEIKAGLPVVAGILHHGPATHPTGGGHYVALFGFDPTGWFVNDPYGELDLVNGGWSRQGGGAGRDQRYSFANFNPRWLPEGAASGWAWLFS
jgi:hypothetical protein